MAPYMPMGPQGVRPPCWSGFNYSSILNLVFFLLVAVGFSLTAFISHWGFVTPAWGHLLIAAAPVGLFLVLLLLSLQKDMRGALSVLLSCLLAVACFTANAGNLLFMCFTQVYPTTNTHYYTRMLRIYGYPDDGLNVFPRRIPEDALLAEMYHQPQFLQGSGIAELLVQYSPEDFAVELERVEALADADASYMLDVGENFDITITDTWEYFICISEPGSDGSWNHGYAVGAAATRRDHYILYFRHQW